MFQLLIMTLLPLLIRNPVICRVSIGYWLQTLVTNYFADPLGRPIFLKQQYKQIMPDPLQSQSSVCSLHVIYAGFHLFKFGQEEITGVHDVNVFHS